VTPLFSVLYKSFFSAKKIQIQRQKRQTFYYITGLQPVQLTITNTFKIALGPCAFCVDMYLHVLKLHQMHPQLCQLKKNYGIIIPGARFTIAGEGNGCERVGTG
jgi:hypothetical protein